MIAAQASTSIPPSTLNPAILAPRAGPKPKPLAERQSLHALRLVHHNPITTTTTDGLLAQFKASNLDQIDSDSDSPDKRRRSYSREQRLAAVGYATTNKQVWHPKAGEMVLISHKQACRDLGLDPVQLRR
jgi:hypothetical protein